MDFAIEHTSRLRRVALALVVAVLTPSTHSAQAMPPQGPPPPTRLDERIEMLDLNDAVRERILAILDSAEVPRRQTERAVEGARRKMRSLLADPATTDEAIRTAADELDQLEHRAHQQRTDVLLKVRAALPEKLRGSLASPPRGEQGERRDGSGRGSGHCGDRSDEAPEPLEP